MYLYSLNHKQGKASLKYGAVTPLRRNYYVTDDDGALQRQFIGCITSQMFITSRLW